MNYVGRLEDHYDMPITRDTGFRIMSFDDLPTFVVNGRSQKIVLVSTIYPSGNYFLAEGAVFGEIMSLQPKEDPFMRLWTLSITRSGETQHFDIGAQYGMDGAFSNIELRDGDVVFLGLRPCF